MPIDPRKFKKIVTNHFDNLTEEEFITTLHKSSHHFVECVNLALNGKVSDFLVDFLDSIDPHNLRIDCNKLNNNTNSTFVSGFSLLIEALQSRQWINLINNGEYIISEQHYENLMYWLSQEVVIQDQEEANQINSSKTFSDSIRNVEVSILTSTIAFQ
jgi:hypothetical protein